MGKPSDRQLLNAAYSRYRVASRLAGYQALPYPLWLESLRDYALEPVVVEEERSLISLQAPLAV